MRLIFVIFLIFLLTACASKPLYVPPDLPDAELSTVYIYRPDEVFGAIATPKVYLDNNYIGGLSNGSYLKTRMLPGDYELVLGKKEGDWANWSPDTLSLRVILESNSEYYFRMHMDSSNFSLFLIPMGYSPVVLSNGKARVFLERIEREAALDELKQLGEKK